MPSLKRLASGRRWNTLTAVDVPKNVDVVDVETLSRESVYATEARSSGSMSG